MNDEKSNFGDIMQSMMATIMLVLVSQIIQILPQSQGQLAITGLEIS